ncbi:hypothetical protein MtrunA17_Chr8g0392491 [Medicago truncatula]|uniref:Uncharacterized protein n=1 Tax=Medicago truncatula TaxID=3880 RepID=A0A396GYE9_MEDTR|nr:hypothetical protein MtrunA17_Chr8g0392491 [Medicago truncatula]
MMDFEASDNPKCDASVEKMDNTMLPVKRLFDNSNSLIISVKKSKMSPYDNSFSSLREELDEFLKKFI